MLRGLMVVLALAATAAHAQETKAASSSSDAAPAKAAGEREIVLASRTTPEPRSPPLARSAGAPDAGADAGVARGENASKRAADCSSVEIYLAGAAPVVRNYQMPPLEQQGPQEQAQNRLPFVKSITRCGRLYVFQVWSKSQDSWVIDRARLEGPKGEVLQVNALRFSALEDGWSNNVIVAEAPSGAKLASLRLHLTGQDGRVAQPEARELP